MRWTNSVLSLATLLFANFAGAGVSTYSSCPFTATQLEVEIQSQLTISKLALEKARGSEVRLLPATDPFVIKSIEQQLKYYQTDFRHLLEKQEFVAVFNDQPAKVERVIIKATTMPQGYALSKVEHAAVKIEEPYMLAALEIKNIPESSKAFKVEYTAKLTSSVCALRDQPVPKQLPAPKAPIDPWLTHWSTKTETWKSVRWMKSRFTIPQHFDSEYADLPDPTYAWYFWSPSEVGSDVNGNAYQASSVLITGKNAVTAVVRISKDDKIKKFDQYLASSETTKVLRATIVFGRTDAKYPYVELSKIFSDFASGGPEEWDQIRPALSKWNDRDGIDRGSSYATGFLLNSWRFMNQSDFKYAFNSKTKTLELNGKLLVSGRPLKLRFFFGSTDVFADEKPEHLELAYDAFKEDDVVLYIGHSGLGENFKLSSLLETAKTTTTSLPKKSRVVGIFSCYSYMYFTRDLESTLGENQLLVLTGSSYTSARGPVGLMEWIDRSQSKTGATQFNYLESQDFLIFRSTGQVKL